MTTQLRWLMGGVVVAVVAGALALWGLRPASGARTRLPRPRSFRRRRGPRARVPDHHPRYLATPSFTSTFTSTRFGYSIGVPAGETSVAGTAPWSVDLPSAVASYVDRLTAANVRLVVASKPASNFETWKAG